MNGVSVLGFTFWMGVSALMRRALSVFEDDAVSGVSSWISRLSRWRFMFDSALMRRAVSVSEDDAGFADDPGKEETLEV